MVAAESESPIMPLESVLGFEVERSNLAERTMKGSGETKLVQVDEKASDFKVARRWDPAYVSFGYVRVPGKSGDFLGGQTVKPKSPDFPPAVILLDEELRYFESPGAAREDQDLDEAEGMALGRLPLGSHLIANGFAVLFPAKDDFEKKRRFQARDWNELIEKWVKRSRVDRDSLFLVATHENAQMALTLASQIRFAGVVIEAPRQLMFQDTKKEREEREAEESSSEEESEEGALDLGVFESEAQLKRYLVTVKSQRAPIQLVASKEQIKEEVLRNSLLRSFSLTGADLRATVLDELARRRLGEGEDAAVYLDEEREEAEEGPPAFSGRRRGGPQGRPKLAFGYEREPFEKWVTRMLNFMLTRSHNEPFQIPEPQRGERGPGGRGGIQFPEPRDFGGGDDGGGGGDGGDGGDGGE